jgi:pimeloyl-ACP methyl ester carboxylesterase
LHCSLAHGGIWANLAAHLPDVTVIAPDLPGHGALPLWDGRSDLHGDSTRLAIGLAQEAAGVDLIGHSFGATVALRMALERPDLVRSLVLIEPVLFAAARALGDASFAGFVSRHAAFACALAEGRKAEAAQIFLAQWGDGTPWDDLSPRQQRYVTDRIEQVASLDPVLVGDAAGMLGYMRLEALGMPVLLLHGDQSPAIIAAIIRALADRLPQARVQEISGAAHMAPVTHADQVAAAIQSFLATTQA